MRAVFGDGLRSRYPQPSDIMRLIKLAEYFEGRSADPSADIPLQARSG